MILFSLFLIISCSKIDYLGPTLTQRNEAAIQAANNLNFEKKKASYLTEAYLNNIKAEEIERVKDFIFEMESNGSIEDKIYLIIDCYENYKFKDQDYLINAQVKENIRNFIRGRIEAPARIIEIDKTLQNLKVASSEGNKIFKNFDMEIALIEETLKLYNQFIGIPLEEKERKLKIASSIIFNNSSRSIIVKELIENNIEPKELESLYQEASKILSINKGRRLA